MASRWHVIRTEARAEYLAAGELGRDGFEVFFPRVKVAHPARGHADAPLFPGYLFLRCDLENDGLPSFRRTRRILGWVRFGNDIGWLPDQVLDEIRQRSEMINQEGGLRRRFRSGELVRIVSGAIQGLAQVVEDGKSVNSKVKVLLEFMGRSVLAQVPEFDLEPVEDQTPEEHRVHRRTRGRGRWIRGYGSSPALGF